MPELPEVETTLRGVSPWTIGYKIKKIKIHNASLRWPIPPEVHTLEGLTIVNAYRRAKYLIFELSDNQHLMMHLGMSGVIRVVETKEKLQKHDHFEMFFDHSRVMRFNDPRRFGCILLVGKDPNKHVLLENLGPEPLTENFNGQWLKEKSAHRTVAVKNFIMNNHIVVGVGNIYAAESLFLSGIHPKRAAKNISLKRYEVLAENIKEVLSNAIKAGGTTLNDFKNTDGKPGYFQQKLFVYGRQGKACYQCGSIISHSVLGQRASCFCKVCQK